MKNYIDCPVTKTDRRIGRNPLHFGTVLKFRCVNYIFHKYVGLRVMVLTMDAQKHEILDRVEFINEAKWLYQLTVKFYKGFDYAFTDDGLIINQHTGKVVKFCESTTSKLIDRSRQSANYYLRHQYTTNKKSYDYYRSTIYACMVDHFRKHRKDYLMGF